VMNSQGPTCKDAPIAWSLAFEERELPGNARDQRAQPSPDHAVQGLAQGESPCIKFLVLGDYVAGVASTTASQEPFKVSRGVLSWRNRDDPPRIEVAEVSKSGGDPRALLWIRE
jgi:hypothetical protein